MNDKKDVLEFPLEELEVPQAIALMMVAATKCVHPHRIIAEDGETVNHEHLACDEERLQSLVDKLEAFIEDKLELAAAVRLEPTDEDAPNEEAVDDSSVFLMGDNQEIANVRGVVYQKSCNERVYSIEGTVWTYCIKRWGHQGITHEDEFGNEAPR